MYNNGEKSWDKFALLKLLHTGQSNSHTTRIQLHLPSLSPPHSPSTTTHTKLETSTLPLPLYKNKSSRETNHMKLCFTYRLILIHINLIFIWKTRFETEAQDQWTEMAYFYWVLTLYWVGRGGGGSSTFSNFSCKAQIIWCHTSVSQGRLSMIVVNNDS